MVGRKSYVNDRLDLMSTCGMYSSCPFLSLKEDHNQKTQTTTQLFFKMQNGIPSVSGISRSSLSVNLRKRIQRFYNFYILMNFMFLFDLHDCFICFYCAIECRLFTEIVVVLFKFKTHPELSLLQWKNQSLHHFIIFHFYF